VAVDLTKPAVAWAVRQAGPDGMYRISIFRRVPAEPEPTLFWTGAPSQMPKWKFDRDVDPNAVFGRPHQALMHAATKMPQLNSIPYAGEVIPDVTPAILHEDFLLPADEFLHHGQRLTVELALVVAKRPAPPGYVPVEIAVAARRKKREKWTLYAFLGLGKFEEADALRRALRLEWHRMVFATHRIEGLEPGAPIDIERRRRAARGAPSAGASPSSPTGSPPRSGTTSARSPGSTRRTSGRRGGRSGSKR